MKRLGRKSVFGSPRRAVFLKNTCSGLPEVLFFPKILVRDSPKRCFHQKQSKHTRISCVFLKNSRNTPRISYVFFKNGRSNPLDGLFFSKTDVPTPWTGLTIKNILQCGYS